MKVLTTVLLLAAGVAVAGNAFADDGFRLPGLSNFGIAPAPSKLIDNQPKAVDKAKPLESVLAAIDRRLPGRALDARMVEWQGRQAYAIRWIGDDGQVRDITADAVSGDILDER
ncbi:MAG: PepSY domain-containing protein [Geminicoccaceae bacterium]